MAPQFAKPLFKEIVTTTVNTGNRMFICKLTNQEQGFSPHFEELSLKMGISNTAFQTSSFLNQFKILD